MLLTRGYMPALKRLNDQRKVEAERKRARAEGYQSGRNDGHKAATRDYERQHVLHIQAPKGRDNICLGEEPKTRVHRVLLAERTTFVEDFDPRMCIEPIVVDFRAKRETWRCGTGHTVTWWTWEPMR